MKYLSIAIVFTMTACSTLSTKPSLALIRASCPPLTPLTDRSFAATTSKLIEVAETYNTCRTATGVDHDREEKEGRTP